MIRGEWRAIFHSKILWISVAVMILIPFLYSVFFLTSVWDPYGDTKNLPVAVVNEDQPVKYQGKRLAVGEEMVKSIKKNDQLGWHFVSADEAKAGLANHKYYTVVTIPANFSKHATTVTSKHPQKMKLHYSTNASLNYIAKVISDAGATQLNQNVRASVTKAYALAMFKQVKTAGKGFSKAAAGAKQLKNGGVVLQDGLTTYTTGVHTLKDGTTELNTKVQQLPAGIAKLANGGSALKAGLDTMNNSTGELASGVTKLEAGSGQVTDGLKTMNNSTGALASGVSQLNTGAKALNVGVVQYTDGVYELRSGLQQLNGSVELRSKVSQLEKGADKTAAGSKTYTGYVSDLADGNKKLNDKVQPIGDQVPKLTTNVDKLANGSKDLVQKMTELQNGGQEITDLVGTLHSTVGSNDAKTERQKLTQGMSDMNDALTALAKQLETMSDSDSQAKLTALMTDMQKQATQLATPSSSTTSVTDQINSKIDGLKDSQNLSDAQVTALKDSLASVGQSQDAADATAKANAAKSLSTDMQALAQVLSTLNS